LFTWNSGTSSLAVDGNKLPSPYFSPGTGSVINNLGTIVFQAFSANTSNLALLQMSAAGTVSVIVDGTIVESPYRGLGFFTMNNHDQVVFGSGLKSSPSAFGIFLTTGTQTRTIADNSTFTFGAQYYVLNDLGQVIFLATAPKAGDWLNDGVSNTFIVGDTNRAKFNNLGTLVYGTGSGPQTPASLVIVAAGVSKTVVQGNSSVFNVPVAGFAVGGFNDKGQILFEADFTDGTKALYRADPQ
jgi:hypothetical protein